MMNLIFSHKKNALIIIFILGILAHALSGCAPLIIGGGAGAATVAMAATEERGIEGFWDDTKIKSQILWHYTRQANALSSQVDVVVRQGRVLLTGMVDHPELKVEAVKLAWKVPGVQEVIDEISLENHETMASYTNDIWLTTKVKSNLLFEKGVRFANYNVQTIDGVVYLMGIAPNAQELQKVIYITSRVNGVKEVVNFVQVNDRNKKPQNKKKTGR